MIFTVPSSGQRRTARPLLFAKVVALLVFLASAVVAVPAIAQDPPVSQQAEDPPAPTQAIDTGGAAETAPSTMGSELSPWTMFMAADVVVKAVMGGLAFASLVTWTVFFAKSIEILRAGRNLRTARRKIAGLTSLAEAEAALKGSSSMVARLVRAASREHPIGGDPTSGSGVQDRVASVLADLVQEHARHMRTGMGLLATIGATAPFVGLFGTVWGIMNSFIGISKSHTTNLAVVAPGIAEALLATAIGLVAAIPAVVIYNLFARSTKSYLDQLRIAANAIARMSIRDGEMRSVSQTTRVVD